MRGKAVILPDRLQVKYQDVDIPEPSEGDVVIEVKHSWISIGTESSYFRGERVNGEEPYREGAPWPYPYARWLQTIPLITHRFPADQVEAAWQLITDKKAACLGLLTKYG